MVWGVKGEGSSFAQVIMVLTGEIQVRGGGGGVELKII